MDKTKTNRNITPERLAGIERRVGEMARKMSGGGYMDAAVSPIRRFRLKFTLPAFFLVSFVLLILWNPVWKVVTFRTCAYTESRRSTTTLFKFLTTTDTYDESPLEKWLLDRGETVEHKWMLLTRKEYGVWSLSRGCASSPPIYSFPFSELDGFLKLADESQVRELLALLRKPENAASRAWIKRLLLFESEFPESTVTEQSQIFIARKP